MGKVMPLTKDGKVRYDFYNGHFMKAIARAYKNILNASEGEEPAHVALVINKINRGNSAAIFGTAFQLLDRGSDGWSVYKVNLSEMEFEKLLSEVGFKVSRFTSQSEAYDSYTWNGNVRRDDDVNEILAPLRIKRNQLRIPLQPVHPCHDEHERQLHLLYGFCVQTSLELAVFRYYWNDSQLSGHGFGEPSRLGTHG